MKSILDRFQPRVLGSSSPSALSYVEQFEGDQEVHLPEALRAILLGYRGAVIFDIGARFRPARRTLLEDDDGYHHLELLYGASSGPNGIKEKNDTYSDQLPSSLLAFGEIPGGNLVCINRETGQVFIWHHEDDTQDAAHYAAESVESLFAMLEPVSSQVATNKSKVDMKRSRFGF
jgi:hypothetical protein